MLNCVRVIVVGFLAYFWSTPSLAILPALPPSCESLRFDAETVPELVERVKTPPDRDYQPYWTPYCATIALSHKGKTALQPLMTLMRDPHEEIRLDATEALCGLKGMAAEAVPLLVDRITKEAYPTAAYDALVCIGANAISVVPMLIRQSTSDDGTNLGRAKSIYAVKALGGFGRQEPRVIVPHLEQLLDDPLRASAAANSLDNIGRAARASIPALERRLSLALAARSDEIASSIIFALSTVAPPSTSLPIIIPLLEAPGVGTAAAGALLRIGPKAHSAIPFIVRRLDENVGTDWTSGHERVCDVDALVAIDSNSLLVRRRLLAEVLGNQKPAPTRDMSDTTALVALEKMDALPTEFIPALKDALTRAPDSMTADSYRLLLSHAQNQSTK